MEIINIKEYFKQEKEKMRQFVLDSGYEPPSLLIVDATDGDPANDIYVRNKVNDFENLGWPVEVARPRTQTEARNCIHYTNKDFIIIQSPIREDLKGVIDFNDVPDFMDCDGLSDDAKVLPATVRGIADYLEACDFPFSGKSAVVLGRSKVVGKPMADWLLSKDMTVTILHSKSSHHNKMTALYDADLVIAATPLPQSVFRYQCPFAFVVDVGISQTDEGKLVGNFVEQENFIRQVDYMNSEGSQTPSTPSTPVPGGVGLLTRLGLMKNCYDLKYNS